MTPPVADAGGREGGRGGECVCVLGEVESWDMEVGGGSGGPGTGGGELLETPLKVGGADVAALQRARDVRLKEPPV